MSDEPPQDIAAQDTPIHRATIDQLPIATLDAWLIAMRERRLVIVQKLENARAAKRNAYLKDVEEKYTKMYDRVKLNLGKLEEMTIKVESYLNKLRALELELSDIPDEEDEDASDEPIRSESV